MKLLWLDLETTGLDPRTDRILEIAVAEAFLATPFDISQNLGFPRLRSWVLSHDGQGLSPFILDMHTKNGLLAECAKGSVATLESVENHLITIVPMETNKEEKTVLAGNSVHFDLAFIRHWMPRLAKRLSHRVYDVSAIQLFAQSMGMPAPVKGPEPHRAVDDVIASIKQAEGLAVWFRAVR